MTIAISDICQGWGLVGLRWSCSHWFKYDGRSLCRRYQLSDLRQGEVLARVPCESVRACVDCRAVLRDSLR